MLSCPCFSAPFCAKLKLRSRRSARTGTGQWSRSPQRKQPKCGGLAVRLRLTRAPSFVWRPRRGEGAGIAEVLVHTEECLPWTSSHSRERAVRPSVFTFPAEIACGKFAVKPPTPSPKPRDPLRGGKCDGQQVLSHGFVLFALHFCRKARQEIKLCSASRALFRSQNASMKFSRHVTSRAFLRSQNASINF